MYVAGGQGGHRAPEEVLVWLSDDIWSPLYAHLSDVGNVRENINHLNSSLGLFLILCYYYLLSSFVAWISTQQTLLRKKVQGSHPHTVFIIRCVKSVLKSWRIGNLRLLFSFQCHSITCFSTVRSVTSRRWPKKKCHNNLKWTLAKAENTSWLTAYNQEIPNSTLGNVQTWNLVLTSCLLEIQNTCEWIQPYVTQIQPAAHATTGYHNTILQYPMHKHKLVWLCKFSMSYTIQRML